MLPKKGADRVELVLQSSFQSSDINSLPVSILFCDQEITTQKFIAHSQLDSLNSDFKSLRLQLTSKLLFKISTGC
uniref:Uncharacterized protein n=1 Tax=Manihot esculenta TaxID=3983 RepID=A0A2C9VUV2_MANES